MPAHSVPSSSLSTPSSFPSLLMFRLFFLSIFSTVALAQATISSPASVTECLPQQLTVSGGEPPYTITVLPGGETGGPPLETLPTLEQAGTVRWMADIPAGPLLSSPRFPPSPLLEDEVLIRVPETTTGQDITFAVRDNTGAVNFSAQVPVLAGSSQDCIGDNASTGTVTTTTGSASATVSGSTTTSATDEESSTTSGGTTTSGSASRTTSASTGSGTTSRTTSTTSPTATETGNGAAVGGKKSLALPAALLAIAAFA
ncbi:hypothetical protein JCM11251_002024 [Rhodosporidiobolus azoricus]